MTEPKHPQEKWPPPAPDLPKSAHEIVQEVERLRDERPRFELFRVRFRTPLLLVSIIFLLWWVLR